jgi:ribonuclease D
VPPPRVWAEKDPMADRRLKGARAALLAVSEELSIPVENLLMPETLRRVSWAPPEPLSLDSLATALRVADVRQWQIEVTLQPIFDAFVDAVQEPAPVEDPVS